MRWHRNIHYIHREGATQLKPGAPKKPRVTLSASRGVEIGVQHGLFFPPP